MIISPFVNLSHQFLSQQCLGSIVCYAAVQEPKQLFDVAPRSQSSSY